MKQTFLGYLAAPFKAMGALRVIFAGVPALLAVLSFLGVHNSILEGLGLREDAATRWATLYEAAACGSAVTDPSNGHTEIKVCGDEVSGLTFDRIVATADPWRWITGSHHSMVRTDCQFGDIAFAARFGEGDDALYFRPEQENLVTLEEDGINARFRSEWVLPSNAPGGEAFAAQYRLVWICPEGQVIEVGDWVTATIPDGHTFTRKQDQ